MKTIDCPQESRNLSVETRSNGGMRAGLTIACLLAGTVAAAAQGGPTYGNGASGCIPFADQQSPPFIDPPRLMLKVFTGQGQDLQPVAPKEGAMPLPVRMDTGSTGFLIGYDQIPNYQTLKNTNGKPGYQFYSSSKILSVGTWIPATVNFYDASGTNVVASASVPVLGVEQSGTCPGYTAESGDTCPGGQLKSVENQGILYMGVGFGQEADFMPQAIPVTNPLLNLTTVVGQPVDETFNKGYIIGRTGVTVGLSSGNTQGFQWIQLSSFKPANFWNSEPQIDWNPASMCVQIDSSSCYPGTVLVDTGVSQSYITIPVHASFPTAVIPDPSNPLKTVGALVPTTSVTVKLPGSSNPVAEYGFTVGGTSTSPVPVVIPDWPPQGQTWPGAFVNTGRLFLQEYQFLYDAENGYVGLKTPTAGCAQ